jgi:hypothetical protein
VAIGCAFVRPRRALWAVCLSITAVILGVSATVVSGPVFLDVGTVDVGTVATILGNVLAATAVIIASLELRRAKRSEERARLAAAEERRRVFEVAQLVALAEVIADFGKSPTWLEEIRIRLLPAWMLPVARRWIDDGEGLYNWFVAELLPKHPGDLILVDGFVARRRQKYDRHWTRLSGSTTPKK